MRGKNFFVYAESQNGAALQCFAGENAVIPVGGGVSLTYPGATQLPAANCTSTLAANSTITIYVDASSRRQARISRSLLPTFYILRVTSGSERLSVEQQSER
ncbi:MAG: hypothetical protein M3Z64_01295 [Verrucomicrobiota bacterium]|nr:hypothetical protein [Verrucomicrobiota bacterium]